MAESASRTCAEQSTIVGDGNHDIAKNYKLDTMMIGVGKRRRFQQSHLWTPLMEDDKVVTGTKRKRTIITFYNEAIDGPKALVHPYPTIPGNRELIHDSGTKLYLEVGLVIGDEPDRYTYGSLGSKRWPSVEEVMPRDSSAMRVFTPVCENIQPSRFYVGCHPHDGHLIPRIITATSVFFYPEFWDGVDCTLSKRNRLIEVKKNCNYHATVNKTFSLRNCYVSDTPHNLGSTYLDSSPAANSETINPNVGSDLIMSNGGVRRFLEFSRSMTTERSVMVTCGLKMAFPSLPNLGFETVKMIHDFLRSKDTEQQREGARIGDRLTRSGLSFFLEMCHTLIGSLEHDKEIIARNVKLALTATGIHERHPTIT